MSEVIPELVEQAGVGTPDQFARLWTPDRMAYIANKKPGEAPGEGCPFCDVIDADDEEKLIVARGTHIFVILNLFPYNAGHLLVIPYRHIADYTDLTDEETAELADTTQHAIRVARTVTGAQGFNIGINLGTAAGAGIAAHLHQHIVPRWVGDANFMPVIGHTKALPQLLAETRRLFAGAW